MRAPHVEAPATAGGKIEALDRRRKTMVGPEEKILFQGPLEWVEETMTIEEHP